MDHAFPPLPMPQATKRTVVVIEPSITVRTVIEVALRWQGYTVVSFAQPLPALLALFRRQITLPALLLLSEQRGRNRASGPDGIQILYVLAQWKLPLHVILVLEEPSVLASIQFQVAGASACLARPFRLQHLLHLVQVYGYA